jgi:hypothetical protein
MPTIVEMVKDHEGDGASYEDTSKTVQNLM